MTMLRPERLTTVEARRLVDDRKPHWTRDGTPDADRAALKRLLEAHAAEVNEVERLAQAEASASSKLAEFQRHAATLAARVDEVIADLLLSIGCDQDH